MRYMKNQDRGKLSPPDSMYKAHRIKAGGMASKRQTIFIKTFGCQMNFRDSEVMAGILKKEGFEIVDNPALADVALVNTCCVREHAEDRAYGVIWELKKLRKKNPALLIGLCGCLAEKEKENIFRKAPHVNVVISPHSFYRLPAIIKSLKDTSERIISSDTGDELFLSESIALRPNLYQASVAISRGCNNFCSFCIVPYVRGREKSAPPDEILETVKALGENGVKEITLLGQNVLSYGKDLRNVDFTGLLEKMNEIPGIERIRFFTAHPRDVNEELIKTIARLPKICEHLHFPVQSGSDRVLEWMNRGYTRNYYLEIIKYIRKIIPEAAITTDIIVGFPGETEEDFKMTRELIEEVRFDNAFIFKYSHRQGTAAAKLEDAVSKEEKERRLAELLTIQEKIAFKKNEALLNRRVEVLAEKISSRDKTRVVGRTRTNKIVIFSPLEKDAEGPAGINRAVTKQVKKDSLTGFKPQGDILGKTVNVLIEETGSWRLLGKEIT